MICAVLAAAGSWLAVAAAPGEPVVFTSTAVGVPEHTDPLTISWHLDGDGARGDSSGGHEAVAERTIHVARPTSSNQPPVAAFERD